MGLEIEKKFLVKGDSWRSLGKASPYRQGYLSSEKERTVRVRTIEDKAYLTIKGISRGAVRSEWEYEIPYEDALTMLEQVCETPLIEKVRHKIEYEGLIWEVDEFSGENEGLIVAEVELQSEEQTFDKPEWIGPDVTEDPRYFNANLIHYPYRMWKDDAPLSHNP